MMLVAASGRIPDHPEPCFATVMVSFLAEGPLRLTSWDRVLAAMWSMQISAISKEVRGNASFATSYSIAS
jgi:hypothetical protein